jgi:hypothetical protein
MINLLVDALLRLALGTVGNSMGDHRRALAGRGWLVRAFFPDVLAPEPVLLPSSGGFLAASLGVE